MLVLERHKLRVAAWRDGVIQAERRHDGRNGDERESDGLEDANEADMPLNAIAGCGIGSQNARP